MNNQKQEPLFGQYAGATLERCMKVFRERGAQYSDTMRECQFLMMHAVARELGVNIPHEYLRVLCIAGFADMKYARNLGGYKEDSVEDQINYNGFVAEEMRQIKAGTAEPVAGKKKELNIRSCTGREVWFTQAPDHFYWIMHESIPKSEDGARTINALVLKDINT